MAVIKGNKLIYFVGCRMYFLYSRGRDVEIAGESVRLLLHFGILRRSVWLRKNVVFLYH